MTHGKHSARLVVLLVILAVVTAAGILFYTVGAPLVLMAVQQAREASRRKEVEDNLKQLGLALHNYQQSYSAKPSAAEKTYTNPVGETPLHMGDPFVIQHDGRYYLFGTYASNDGFKYWESTDLVHWEEKGWAYRETDDSWAKSHYWAPEVEFYQGKFYMTYSANHTGFPHYGIGYAMADKPLGPWVKAAENPIAATNLEIGVSGPGHSCITSSPDGTEMFIIYHTHADAQKPSDDRLVNMDRISFDESGKLTINGPTRSPQPIPSGSK